MAGKTKSKKKTNFSITVTGDETSTAKGEKVTVEELNSLLATGISTKSKRKALVAFLTMLSENSDSLISEMFFGSPIYRTWNYDKFKKIKGNRTVKYGKVDKLAQSIDEGMNLLPYCPVLVDKESQICDGQHRFETAKNSGLPVYYMIIDEMALEDIAKMNSNSNSWTISDYLNLYVELGRTSYVTLDKFIKKNKIPVSTAIVLFAGFKENRVNVMNDFKSGDFEIDDEKKKVANRVMAMVKDFSEFGESLVKKRAFINTMMTLVEKEQNKEDYSHTKMMQKMHQVGMKMFTEQHNKHDYLRMLENIYNYQLRSGKIRLY